MPRFLLIVAAIASPLSLLICFSSEVQAQSITAADDGTGTQINSSGRQHDINGGTRAGDNLFHSFERFGLDTGEIANFLSNPDIQNILGRVVGGDASFIDGLIQVTGGNSNLFLMNPAGIIFGDSATLNVPADFTATTATGIGFDDQWFSAVGDVDYAALVGNPSSFAFGEAGALVNEGELGVSAGQRLTLLGGTVINTGTLRTQGGQVTVAAVPGENLVRISQENGLLSLEMETLAEATPEQLPNAVEFSPGALPELLTGGEVGSASDVAVNADGTVTLAGSGLAVEPTSGTLLASGTVDASDVLPEGAGGAVQVLGDRVALLGADVNASGNLGGGTVHVGGAFQGGGTTPTATRTLVDETSNISADAIALGDGGEVVLWSEEVTGFYGSISARGGSTFGDGGLVEVSGRETLVFDGVADVGVSNGSFGEILLDPTNIVIFSGNGGDPSVDASLAASGQILADDFSGETITISEATLESLMGDVTLEATNTIVINNLVDNELSFIPGTGTITFNADADGDGTGLFTVADKFDVIATNGRNIEISGAIALLGSIDTVDATSPDSSTSGAISVNADSIEIGGASSLTENESISLTTSGQDVQLQGDVVLNQNTIIETGDMAAGNISASSNINGNFGLTLDAGTGLVQINNSVGNNVPLNLVDISASTIDVGNINTEGTVNLNALGDISIGAVNTRASDADEAGSVTISSGGNISVGTALDEFGGSFSILTPGRSITLSAAGNITTGNIDTDSSNFLGILDNGSVNLSTASGNITVGYIFAGSGGVDVDSAGSFRALDTIGISSTPTEDAPPILAMFLADRGYPTTLEDEFSLFQINNFLLSIRTLDGPVTIRYGQNREPIIEPVVDSFGSTVIEIEGDPEFGFIIGPDYDEENPFLDINGNVISPADGDVDEITEFQANANSLDSIAPEFSGTVAGIASIRANATLVTSVQNRPLESPDMGAMDPEEPVEPIDPDPIEPIDPIDPDPIDPDPDPVDPDPDPIDPDPQATEPVAPEPVEQGQVGEGKGGRERGEEGG
ncbi:MAG: filamentous hemagglutinin N-terminal domain-containing protein, partial [Elainellaceae cyanobacterium]